MWLKNAAVLGFNRKAQIDLALVDNLPFAPTTDLQAVSSGWGLVRDQRWHCSSEFSLLHFTIEKRPISGAGLKLLLEARCADLEDQQGFAPGKKARKELKELLIDELLPRALPVRRVVKVLLDHIHCRILIDSTSTPVIAAVNKALLRTFGDIGIQDAPWPSSDVLTNWMRDGLPDDFTHDDAVTLQFKSGKVVKYKDAQVGEGDVQQSLKLGAEVVALDLTFDSKLSFIMTDNYMIKRIKPLAVVKDKTVDAFDNDFALVTGEMRRLLLALEAAA